VTAGSPSPGTATDVTVGAGLVGAGLGGAALGGAALGVAALVALAAAVPGRGPLAGAVGLVQAGLVLGLLGRLHRTSRPLGLLAGLAAAVTADAFAATGIAASLRPLVAVVGLAAVGALTAHVLRKNRDGTTASLLAVTSLAVLAVAPTVLVVARGLPSGSDAATLVALAAGSAACAALPGRAGAVPAAVGVVVGTVTAALVAAALPQVEVADGVVLGLPAAAGAVLAWLVLAVDARAPDRVPAALGRVGQLGVVAVTLPLVAGLTAGGLVARLVLG